MVDIVAYLSINYPFFLVTLVVLFTWDLMDFYIELKELVFLYTRTFWVYFAVRGFFSVSLLEIASALNLVNISNKFILAFIVPLLFTVVLQNLLIEVGGEQGVNVKEVFSGFRNVVVSGLKIFHRAERVKVQTLLMDNQGISTESLREKCGFLAPSPADFAELKKFTEGKGERESRMSFVVSLVEWGGVDYAKTLAKMSIKEHR